MPAHSCTHNAAPALSRRAAGGCRKVAMGLQAWHGLQPVPIMACPHHGLPTTRPAPIVVCPHRGLPPAPLPPPKGKGYGASGNHSLQRPRQAPDLSLFLFIDLFLHVTHSQLLLTPHTSSLSLHALIEVARQVREGGLYIADGIYKSSFISGHGRNRMVLGKLHK